MVYLWLLIFSAAGPLAYSFEKRIQYARKWWALWPSILSTAFYFLIWDELFTRSGVWGFNPHYLLNTYIFSLPAEEVLFFFIVPFACIFLYEITNYYVSRDLLGRYARKLSGILSLTLFATGLAFHDRAYTAVTAFLTATLLGLHAFFWRAPYLGRFYLGYVVSLLPFLLINGILTGSFIAEPIVWYDNTNNLGVRIGTIPIEDSVYLLLMLLSVVTMYEMLLKRWRA